MTALATLYHVTTPDIAAIIMRDGFRDHAAQKGVPGFGITHTFEPGVWFADVPPITAIGLDQYMGHADEAWIGIRITEDEFNNHFVGNEWQDSSWPTRQWLIPAALANQFPRVAVPLDRVLQQRIGGSITAAKLENWIKAELTGETRDRWLAALK